MKFLLKTLGILLAIFILLKLLFYIFDSGHEVSYSVGNFEVDEVLKTKSLYGEDDYYFEVSHEDFNFNFQVPVSYNKDDKVISKLRYEKQDDMVCILPIFKGNKILTDVMCLSDGDNENVMTYYQDLDDNTQRKFADFINSLEKFGYDVNNYEDRAKGRNLSNNLTLYDDNFVDNHYIAMENYKGLTLFNDEEENVELFDNDVYKRPVKLFYDKYYIVANYNEEYGFKIFYVVNIINGNVQEIRSYDDISFETIMQGAVDEEIYFFDKETELQYKISLKYENVEEVADKDKLQYYNGKWNSMALSDALGGKTFDNYYTKAPNGYEKADCIGEDTGYCYYYKKQKVDDKEQYLVYRADVQNTKIKTYLFTTTDMRSVIYLDNFVYFVNGNSLYYYGENGVRQVIANSEREFNDDIHFGVYIN